MISKAPSSPDKPILPPACATWETWVCKRARETEEGPDREHHCCRVKRNKTRCSKSQVRRQQLVIHARPLSAQYILCSPGPQVGSHPGALGDHLSLSAFPVGYDLVSQLSLVIWAGIGSEPLKGGNYVGPPSIPKWLVPSQLPLTLTNCPPRTEGWRAARTLCGSQLFVEWGGLTAPWILWDSSFSVASCWVSWLSLNWKQITVGSLHGHILPLIVIPSIVILSIVVI